MIAKTNVYSLANESIHIFGKLALFPIVATLILLAPIVNVVCGFLLVGGVLSAIVFEVSAVGPRFPFFLVMGLSLGFGLFLLIYHGLIAFLVSER